MAALSQMINSKLFFPDSHLMLLRVVPLHTLRDVDALLTEVENDTVGLIRPNHRGTVVSTLPLNYHLEKPYI